MITQKEKEIIRKVLGYHYSDTIQKYLNSIQLFNIKGNSYSKQSIRNVVNGVRSNRKMEKAITNLVSFTKSAEKKEHENRKKIFEKSILSQ